MEFNCGYMGILWDACDQRVCEKSHQIGESYEC